MLHKKLFLFLFIIGMHSIIYCGQGPDFGKTAGEYTQRKAIDVAAEVGAIQFNKLLSGYTALGQAELEHKQNEAQCSKANTKYHESGRFSADLQAHVLGCGEVKLHRELVPKRNKETGEIKSEYVYKDTPCGRSWADWLTMLEENAANLSAKRKKMQEKKNAKKAAQEVTLKKK